MTFTQLRRAALGGLAAAMLALPAAAQTTRDEAVRAMSAWLQEIDAGRVAESWDGLAPPVQGMVTREAWDAGVRQARASFAGAVTVRTVAESAPIPAPPGAPPGEYLRLKFATAFSGGTAATETVVAMHDGSRWWTGAYNIAPRQTERPDYSAPADAPYTAVDVTVTTPAGHTLAGTLTVPKNASRRVPAVVLISGSGAQDRDAGIPVVPGYRFFRQVADTLGRRGIAVLRLDDRGWGASGGDVSTATTEDLAADVRAAVEWLRTRAEVDPARVALAGHSEGAIIAPMLAVADPRIHAIALLAGPSWTGRRIMDYQLREALRGQGLAGAALDSVFAQGVTERDAVAATIPWVRWFMDHDPLPVARRVRTPVLILHGETDRQVTAGQAEELGAAIRQGGSTDVTVRVFPDLNHLFVPDPVGTADPASYAALPSKEVPAEVLGALADWLAEKLR
jgi:dipeptidyl aminopeptidase/acylaminoacyl peptidase